jgi:transcriptional regulator with XRE-family HTH domain
MKGSDEQGLTRRLGVLLRQERERAGLNQAAFVHRAGLSQQQLSRFEAGRRPVSSALVERLFAVLDLQLRLEVEPADSHLDTAIERVQADLARLQEHWVSNWWSLLWWAPTPHLPVVVDGELAALLQGVPIPVNRVDLIVAERDLDLLAAWIARLPNKQRYRERARDFDSFENDPRLPGPLWWSTPLAQLRVRLMAKLPTPVIVRSGDHDVPVRPLADVERDDEDVARVLRRWRAQSPRGSGGPSTSSASTMV